MEGSDTYIEELLANMSKENVDASMLETIRDYLTDTQDSSIIEYNLEAGFSVTIPEGYGEESCKLDWTGLSSEMRQYLDTDKKVLNMTYWKNALKKKSLRILN